MSRRGSITGTGLRVRSVADKGRILAEVVGHVWPLIAAEEGPPDRLPPPTPSTRSRSAHETLEASNQIGKVLLTI